MRTRPTRSRAPNTTTRFAMAAPPRSMMPEAMMPEAMMPEAMMPEAMLPGAGLPTAPGGRGTLARSGQRLASLLAALALGLLTGCQTARVQAVDNLVTPGDRLYGRLSSNTSVPDFNFEAVEYSVLSAKLTTDEIVTSPPQILLFDPDGQQIPTAGLTRVDREKESTIISLCGLVLRKTGRYAVSVRPTDATEEAFFEFTHALSFPGPIPTPVALVSDKLTHVSVMAPRGARVRVRVVADEGSRVRPQINGVRDPMGGRALDPTRLPRGMRAPTMEEGDDEVILEFTAPETGRYTILNASQAGTCGRATVMTSVKAPCGRRRDVRLGAGAARVVSPPTSGTTEFPATSAIRSPRMAQLPRATRPRTVAPQAVAPWTAAPRTATPRTATPRTATPRTVAPRTAAPTSRFAPSHARPQASPLAARELPVFDAAPAQPRAPVGLPDPLRLPGSLPAPIALPGVAMEGLRSGTPVALLPPPQVSAESMLPRSGQTPPLAPRVTKPELLMPPAPLELPPLGPLPRR